MTTKNNLLIASCKKTRKCERKFENIFNFWPKVCHFFWVKGWYYPALSLSLSFNIHHHALWGHQELLKRWNLRTRWLFSPFSIFNLINLIKREGYAQRKLLLAFTEILSNLEKRRDRRYNYFPIWPWLA